MRRADGSGSLHSWRTPTPRIAVLIGVLFTSTSAILIRLSDAPPLAIAAWRMTFSALLMLVPMVWSIVPARIPLGAPRRLRGTDLLWCIASGFFLALHFASWITSLSFTSVAAATVLVDTHPIFIVVLSSLFLKEKVRRLSLGLILIALAGSVLLAVEPGSGAGGTLYGNGLALFGAIAVSGYLMIGRIVRPRLGVTQYTFLVYASAAAMLLGVCLITGTPVSGFSPVNYLLFAGLAVFPTLLGHSVFNWALRYLPPIFISISVLGEPVLATCMALLVFSEVPTALTVIGGAVVIGAIGAYLLYENALPQRGGRTPVRATD